MITVPRSGSARAQPAVSHLDRGTTKVYERLTEASARYGVGGHGSVWTCRLLRQRAGRSSTSLQGFQVQYLLATKSIFVSTTFRSSS